MAMPHQAAAQGAAALPDRAAFEAYLDLAEDGATDLAAVRALLGQSDDPALRLDLAQMFLQSGRPALAIEVLLPLVDRLAPAEAMRTEVLDMIAAAHLALGNRAQALRAGLMAYQSAVARLGNANPALTERLAGLATLAEGGDAATLTEIHKEHARLAALADGPGAAVRTLAQPVAVPVWFGTNRNDTGGADPADRFGRDMGDLTTGLLTVTIPPGHRPGMIERPSFWSFTSWPDPSQHVVLADLETMAQDAFATGCCGTEDRLLFIHGYNVSFHDGALRAAQLAFDLEFPGSAMYYSWPSRSSLLGYLTDSNRVLPTRPKLAEFLEIATRGEGRLHVIAHSMGNRYFLEAVEAFLRDNPDRTLGQVVLGAPDVDRQELAVRMEMLRERAEGVTLYASRNDLALKVSQQIHGAPRAGDASGEVPAIEGLVTLDASAIEADMLGHSYFGDAPLVLGDIAGLIRFELPPADRCGTRLRSEPVWEIRLDGCPVDVMRAAGDLVAAHGKAALAEATRLRDDAPGEDLDFWLGVMAVVESRLATGE